MSKVCGSPSSKKLALILGAFLLLSDQISKCIVASCFQIGESVTLLPFLSITRVANRGISFGMLSGTVQPYILITVSLIVITALLLWSRKNQEYTLSIVMIVAGALGNIIDRIIYRSVVDFIDFHIETWHWPAFNIADSAIVIGVCIMLFISYGEERL